MGPLYCETPAILTSFPIEPINTWSNLVIIAAGVIAFVLIARAISPRGGLWALATLLIANGIGSFLWHGFRTQTFLSFDVLPGVFFILALAYFWARRFYSRFVSLCLLLLFLLLEAVSVTLGAELMPHGLFFIPIAPPIVLLGAWLVARTYEESMRAAALGGGAILSALVALTFRSIDLSFCSTLPIGTHFLWHIFLSLGALLGILALIVIDHTRLTVTRSKLRMDVHA